MTKASSAEYWQERAERVLLENEKSVLKYEKDLKKAYEKTLSRIKKEMNAFYHKYAKENQIDLATAYQRLNPQELKDFKSQAKIYLEESARLGLDPTYKNYLRYLSAKAYISKLEEIQVNIRHEIELLQNNVEYEMDKALKVGYEDAYYHTLFNVQKQAGFGTNFTALGDKQLAQAVKTKWLGANYSDRVWNNKTNLIKQLEQIIPQEFVRGRGSRQVANDIADRLNVNFNSALRLARTEMNYISSQATLKAYKDSGIIWEYEYLSTLDGRTSDICRELDGKIFKLSEAKAGINLPPMHPNCRSTTVPYFPEDDISEPAQRIARDPDGRVYKVPANMTYKEWQNTFVGGNNKKDFITTPKEIFPDLEVIDDEQNPSTLNPEEERAINKYVSSESYKINDALRNNTQLSEEQTQLIKALDSALKKLPKYSGNLVRDVDFSGYPDASERLEDFLKNFVVDKTITFKEFLSTSKKNFFMEKPSVRIYIEDSTNGHNMASYRDDEDEVLYERNSKFIVENLTKEKGIVYILLKEKR